MNGFQWDWAFTWEVLPMILSAAKVTLLATLLGSIFAILWVWYLPYFVAATEVYCVLVFTG